MRVCLDSLAAQHRCSFTIASGLGTQVHSADGGGIRSERIVRASSPTMAVGTMRVRPKNVASLWHHDKVVAIDHVGQNSESLTFLLACVRRLEGAKQTLMQALDRVLKAPPASRDYFIVMKTFKQCSVNNKHVIVPMSCDKQQSLQ